MPPGVFRPCRPQEAREGTPTRCCCRPLLVSCDSSVNSSVNMWVTSAPPDLPRGVTSLFRRSGSVRGSRSDKRGEERERDPSRAVQDREQPIATKPKGLKKILSKMRRSNSGYIPQEEKKVEEAVEKDQYR